ncbi:MFS transporter [Halopseudomonas phragmitis]|uniref:MFS transporter n=2 Tax=Pseudomonadaceae TaxID=135621 RepID=A0A1V0B7N1_9GAMM|nr:MULTISPECIES: hypothetical protein [Pseudomonadaceae]AQZ95900.1 hypothetical protein BVH74_14570 [Halopseudomonas phragmitis]RHW21086.1 MFS transporter [Pseudomonas jilinensis]
MFNESEYQLIWIAYLGAAACSWLVWWVMTRWAWWFVREPLWVIMAVLLFTPAQVNVSEPWLAPAVIIWGLDTFLNTGDNQARVLGELALVMTLALLAWIGLACLRLAWRHWRGRSAEAAPASD